MLSDRLAAERRAAKMRHFSQLIPRMKKTVLCIIGTRPEVIKMAPVIRALRACPQLALGVLNSGQHRELLVPLVEWFEHGIDADMRVMTQNQTLAQLTAELMRGFER